MAVRSRSTRRASVDEFTATEHDTAEEKAMAANALVRFIEAECPREKFTQRLYSHLHLHLFGHIAHFDRSGFWHVWFRDAAARVRFLENALAPIIQAPEYGVSIAVGHQGDPAHCWSDVERWFAAWITTTGALDRARAERDHVFEQRERAELARLTAKYGPVGADSVDGEQ